MASSKKKRKLPGDLFQATEMARASIASSGNISEAYKALNEATLSNVPEADRLSQHELTTWIVARYGMECLHKVCKVMSGLPESLTKLQQSHYLKTLTGSEDAPFVSELIDTRCPSLCAIFGQGPPQVLAPPVSKCI